MALLSQLFKRPAYHGGVEVYGPRRPLAEPITRIQPPETVVIPLSQHIGAPAKPVVEAGAEVEVGSVLGEPQGFVSTYIHSSVKGVVKGLVTLGRPGGGRVSAVEIQVSADQPERSSREVDWDRLSGFTPEEIKDKVLKAGIVGMGGAGFPTHVKLSPPKDKPIDSVIVNACECEPYLAADSRLVVEAAPELLAGLRLAMQAVGAKKGYIAFEADRVEGIKLLRQLTADFADVEVKVLPPKYPQGSEKHLIKSVLGRTVPLGALPMEVGALVQNVATLISIYRAVLYDEPVTHRVVTVNGGAVANPSNFLVPIGVPIRVLLEAAGWSEEDCAKVVLGGPMMGKTAPSLEEPVTKTTSGVLALRQAELGPTEPSPCIRCGRCLAACPMGLYPGYIAEAGIHNDLEAAEKAGAMACLECGCCAYSCPGNRPLVQEIREAKLKIRQNQQERKGS
ncbi:MAG: electron transport complex subunit RsxC [Firmicutes bacterium]|nr:electron transport complex subunit RsxC [Bacillota bacterium]